MTRVFPVHSKCWRVTHLLRDDASAERSLQASRRLLELAPGLPENSMLSLVLAGDGTGRVDIEIHTDTESGLEEGDIGWVLDKVALVEAINRPDNSMPVLSELRTLVEVAGAFEQPSTNYGDVQLVEPTSTEELAQRANPRYWPIRVLSNCMDLMSALTSCEAQVRVHLAPANEFEQSLIGAYLRQSVQLGGAVNNELYMGSPVRVRCFVGTSERRLPPRLRAALLKLGVGLRLKSLPINDETVATWMGEETSLAGATQPFGMAQCLVPIPASGPDATLCGLKTKEAQLDVVPLTDTELPADGLRLGHAVDELGQQIEVRLGVDDLLLHTQMLGATGTGKSSLLAGLVADAVRAGYGVTVLDAHGPLIDRILAELPAEGVERTVAVYSDDPTHPVPVNVLANDDSDLILDAMLQVLAEIFDPRQEGIVGPRFERVTSQIIKAQQALIGSYANFATVPMWLRDQPTVTKLAEAVRAVDPDLAESLKSELANNRSNEFSEIIAWVNSKYQRLTNSAELRAILLTGADAIDVTELIDDRKVLLVNLASTQIGSLGARFLGEMWLLKHWLAMSQRRDVTRPHLIVVDEAQLFGAGVLPRMLAEARKFGMGVVMAHQHLEQLSGPLREAALANTSNVIVFRSGPREAQTALMRLGNWPSGPLTRLPRLTAAATLSAESRQTEPFTLVVDHNERVTLAEAGTMDEVLRRTWVRYVDPYRSIVPWSHTRVDRVLDEGSRPKAPERPERSTFLEEWLAKRKQMEAEDKKSAQIPEGSAANDDALDLDLFEDEPVDDDTKGE